MCPNPYGNIAGVSDVSHEGWQQRLAEMVAASEQNTARKRAGIRGARLHTAVDQEFVDLLTLAARSRNIATAAYQRRAVAAFVAADLGLSIEDVLKFSPGATDFGVGAPAGRRTTDDGAGYGSWGVR